MSVAVIIPCWNAEKFVARAIQSALDQRCEAQKVIVVDDGSTDRSLDIIRSFGDRVCWQTGPNRGHCAANNTGLSMSGTEYVLFLDTDDYLEPDSLHAWVDAAADADVVFGPWAFEWERTPSKRSAVFIARRGREEIIADWLAMRYVPSCSVLWRASFLRAIGGWDETLRHGEDGELALRGLIEGARTAVSNDGLGVYVQHDSPLRVSKRVGLDIIKKNMQVLRSLRERAKARHLPLEVAFGHSYYYVAMNAFSHRFDDAGREALSEARRCGFRGHLGSHFHRSAATVLGLRNKIRLRESLRKLVA
jgi:glycosyltransferase involved in cell wall biosynthesis